MPNHTDPRIYFTLTQNQTFQNFSKAANCTKFKKMYIYIM